MRVITPIKLRTITTFSLLSLLLIGTAIPSQAALNLGPSSSYIIKVTPTARASIESAVKNAGGSIEKKYQYAFDGYVVKMPDLLASLFNRINHQHQHGGLTELINVPRSQVQMLYTNLHTDIEVLAVAPLFTSAILASIRTRI